MEKILLVLVFCYVMTIASVYAQVNVGGILFFCKLNGMVNEGEKVTMTFLLDDRQYPSRCTTSTNTPQFIRSATSGGAGSVKCTVSDITASCGFTSGTLGCGCVSHADNYWTVEYNFIADATATGYWTANIPCFDAGGFASALKFVTLPSDSLTVQPAATTTSPPTTIRPGNTGRNITCKRTANEGLCYKAVTGLLNITYDPVCYDCEQGYTGPDCRPCTFCRDWDDTCDTAGCLALIIVLCLFGPPIGGGGAAYFYLFVKEKKVELPVKNADKEKIKAFLRPVEKKESIKVDYDQDNKVIITSKDYFNVKGANIFVRNNTSSSSNSTTGGNGKLDTTEEPVP